MLRTTHGCSLFTHTLGVCLALWAAPIALAQSVPPADHPAGTTETSDRSAVSVSPDELALAYREKCARCHGVDGQGIADGYEKPFRTDQSVEEVAKLIVETMPEEDPEACVGDEARLLAEYIRQHFYPSSAENVSPRISRLTVEQYRNAVADVIGHFPISGSVDGSVGSADKRDDKTLDNQRSDLEVPGLRGDYYQSRGMNKADRLGLFRSDTRLEFDFAAGSPAPSISADQFAIIWQGGVIAEHSGHYEFRIQTANGARLYLNMDPQPNRRALRDDSSLAGQQALIDAWVGSGELREQGARVFLLGGRTYPIRLEFFKYLEDDASINMRSGP